MDIDELFCHLAKFLKPDGSYRDIVITVAALDDWVAVIRALESSGAPLEFRVDREPVAIRFPIHAMKWEALADLRHGLVYKPNSVCIKTDFVDINEIEFDVNPSDLHQSIQNFADLVEFMQLIAGATSKPCHLTHENLHDHIALTWDPIARCFTLGPYASGWPDT